MDKLQTNHRGVFVLKDNNFAWALPFVGEESEEALEWVERTLWFPCGVLRGVLGALGVACAVSSEAALPSVSFHVRLVDK